MPCQGNEFGGVKLNQVFDEIKELLTMQEVAEHLGFKIRHAGFISSPFHEERTPSCKLYERSYYDFGAACGGDLIQFTAAVLGVNNWEACRHLIEAFSLPISLSGGGDLRGEIERRKRERMRQQAKEKRFNDARLRAIEDLRLDEWLYKFSLERNIFSPISEERRWTVDKLQETGHKLDVLCGLAGCKADQEKILTDMGYYAP